MHIYNGNVEADMNTSFLDVAMKSIYNIAKSSPDHWPTVFVKVEATVSPDKVTNPLLYHIKHDILPKTSIASAANDLAKVLFGEPSLRGDNNGASKEHHRVNEFLNTAVLRIAKSSWADESLARLVITTVIFAEGVTNYQLSPSGHAVLSKFVKRPIQTWSDPVFIKHASSRERLCNLLVNLFEKMVTNVMDRYCYVYFDVTCIFT